MEYKYYDIDEFNRIISLIKTYPIIAKLKIESYIEKYPTDYAIYPYYSYLLCMLGYIEEAERVLKIVEEMSVKDKRFYSGFKRGDILNNSIVLSKMMILANKKEYDKLYELYIDSIYSKYQIFDATLIKLKKKLGTLSEYEIDIAKSSYLGKQLLDYSKDRFKEHISKHITEGDNIGVSSDCIFVPEFPIDKVLMELDKYIISDKRINFSLIEDRYVFRYDNCGRANNKLVDYFEVITFLNTNQYITMYPSNEHKNYPYIDLNYLVTDNENSKVKRKSQIEKFNERYKNS